MKVLSRGPSPSLALGLYGETGVFAELYPELDGAIPEDLAQALRACDAVPFVRPLVRLSLLLALASETSGPAAGADATATTEEWKVKRNATRQTIESLMKRHPRSGDCGRTGAAVGLYDITVDPDHRLAQGLEIHGGPQSSTDQTRDFFGSPP